MNAILCSRGKGGGCRAVTLPEQQSGTRDLFGRTEPELIDEIARQRRRLEIAEVYRGNQGVADNYERIRESIRVDERQLALMRGERVDYGEHPIRHFNNDQLDKWRAEIARLSAPSERSGWKNKKVNAGSA